MRNQKMAFNRYHVQTGPTSYNYHQTLWDHLKLTQLRLNYHIQFSGILVHRDTNTLKIIIIIK